MSHSESNLPGNNNGKSVGSIQEPSLEVLSLMVENGRARQLERTTRVKRIREKLLNFESQARQLEAETVCLRDELLDVNYRLREVKKEALRVKAEHIGSPERKNTNPFLSIRVQRLPPIDGRWKIIREYHAKEFVSTFEAVDLYKGYVVTVKLEDQALENSQLNHEAGVYERLRIALQKNGITRKAPAILYLGTLGHYSCLVLEASGPSLKMLLDLCPKGLDLKSVSHIGLQVLEQLEAYHMIDTAHSAVNIENIVCGLQEPGTWNLIEPDCQPERGAETLGRSQTQRQSSLVYAAISSHQGKMAGKSSDVESFSYVLLHIATGTLPWLETPTSQSPFREMKFAKAKLSLFSSSFFKTAPSEICQFCKEARSISSIAPASFAILRQLLINLYERQ